MENLAITQTEPILQENPNRFVLFPIEHHKIWEMYKSQVYFGPQKKLKVRFS